MQEAARAAERPAQARLQAQHLPAQGHRAARHGREPAHVAQGVDQRQARALCVERRAQDGGQPAHAR